MTVSVAPSISVLAPAASAPSAGGSRAILIIGDPVSPDPAFPRLANASQEITRIANRFAPDARAVFSGAQAAPPAYLASDPARYAFIHFAAHAAANRESPLRTLAAQSGVSLTQLHRYQAALLGHQHLTLQPRFDPRTGGQLPSGYDFSGLFARLEDLPAGQPTLVETEGARLVLSRVNDDVFACEAECAHQGGPLSAGRLSGTRLTCPWHGWMFDLKSGTCLMPSHTTARLSAPSPVWASTAAAGAPVNPAGLRSLVERVASAASALRMPAMQALRHYGITDIVVNVHHLGAMIEDYLGDGRALGVNISYSRETELLDTGGGLLKARPLLEGGTFVVVNSDVLIGLDLRTVVERHRSTGAAPREGPAGEPQLLGRDADPERPPREQPV